jgi:hypothetical protein
MFSITQTVQRDTISQITNQKDDYNDDDDDDDDEDDDDGERFLRDFPEVMFRGRGCASFFTYHEGADGFCHPPSRRPSR